MKTDIPVIKLLVYKNNYYLYDFAKNHILQLTEELFKQIKILQEIGIAAYIETSGSKQSSDDVITLLNRGYFKCFTVEDISHYCTPYLDVMLDRFLQDLILQVTQDCNFQCRYCLFANDTKVERNHKKINMDYLTAKNSVDYLYSHCADANEVVIGFYGGEPFLNFDLIKHITEYARQKFCSKHIRFLTTTNASLLDDYIIEFLIKNRFEISISLDGDESYQNSHIKFKANGKNTFDIVMQNVIKIRDADPLYFRENVSFNPVIFNDENSERVYLFYEGINVHKDNININKANLNGIDYFDTPSMLFSNQTVSITKDEMKLNSFVKKIEEENIIPKRWHPNGQCAPGVRRLFVTIDGSIYPCEKIIENSAYCIGNINSPNKIDKSKAKKLLNSATITREECMRCWAFRFCEMCISHCLNPSTNCLSKETKLLNCENQKKQIIQMMKLYIDMCKEMPMSEN